MKHKSIYLIAIASIVLAFSIWRLLHNIFENFLSEYFAALLGLLLAFGLDREMEKRNQAKISMQIMNNLHFELTENLALVRRFRKEVESSTFFNLFKVNAWEMFGRRLEPDDITILFKLGETYHDLKLFNEAMKSQGTSNSLGELLQQNPEFLRKMEKDLIVTIRWLETSKQQ